MNLRLKPLWTRLRARRWSSKGHPTKLSELLFLLVLCLIAGLVSQNLQRSIWMEQEIFRIKTKLVTSGFDQDRFRTMELPGNMMQELKELAGESDDFPKMLTFVQLSEEWNLPKQLRFSHDELKYGMKALSTTAEFKTISNYYGSIFNEVRYFPVLLTSNETVHVNYEDSWMAPRSYGGDRGHEGTDMMAENNQRGYFKIISMTDGTIEKIGWLEQGGYRIGIRTDNGNYYYYAHLDSYADDVKEGDKIKAGKFLGYMGDTGYSKVEGTTGNFDVHLHLGIFLGTPDGNLSVNPYYILKNLEEIKESK